MRNPFKERRRRAAYEWARQHHFQMMREGSGRAMAYRRGYNYPESEWEKDWGSYPFFAAGRDTAKAIDALPRTMQ